MYKRQVALLTFVLYRTTLFTHQQQVLTFTPEHIHITAGVNAITQRLSLERNDAYLIVQQAQHQYDSNKLILADKHHKYRIGIFLNIDEVATAKQKILQAGVTECKEKWWQ